VYNGWKRIHALKFHAIITPDGIIIHVWGPVEGRLTDEQLYEDSGVAQILEEHAFDLRGTPLQIYGDPAYGLSTHCLSPFQGNNVTAEQMRFNTAMSSCREAVEWGFGELTSLFPYLDFSKNLKALLQPVGLYYLIGILLCNAHTCLHVPKIPRYFNCHPPTLEEYFSGAPADGFISIEELVRTRPWYIVDDKESNEGFTVNEQDVDFDDSEHED
jgi:hypothetical protein